VNPLLKLAELPYRGVNRLRRSLYRAGILQPKRLPRPVISVGNVSAGGAGKTPAVVAVARHLASLGLRVAVLTRGYGRGPGRVDGTVTELSATKFGDEPVLIKKLTSCSVIVGAKRYKNARRFLRSNDCDVFVLDDGFQHLQLHRDYDLVIDAPARFLREGRRALRHASAVVPRNVRTAVPEDLRGREVFAFAGLADNQQFFEALRSGGLVLAGTREFPDHHPYSADDLARLRRDAGGLPLVTSEKDAVKVDDPSIRTATAEFLIDQAILDDIASLVEKERSRPERRRKRKKNRLVQRLEYVTYRAVAGSVVRMSDPALRKWGGRLGALMRHVLRGRDRLALRNLRRVYPARPPRELRAILDECWRHFGREALVAIRMQNLTPAEIASHVEVIGAELVQDAVARGKGAIFLTAHWGSWEVAGLAAMPLLPRLRTVARALDNELLERDLQKMRERLGAQIIDRRKAARALLRTIADNGVVAMIPDQAVQPREGILVKFLGHPAWTTPAPARLALKTDAPIVFAFCIPVGLGYRLEFEQAIRTEELTGADRDAVALTQRINDVFASWIDRRPELWLWMHDRWKGTEESESMNGA
jgi:lauroyl/myristoyl acyltransferase/tetraacyldisaccharide-1-P 4'-kinase